MEPPTKRFYWILKPARHASALGCWASAVGRFREVVGYTAFGEFFLRDPLSDELALLLPQGADLIATGVRGLNVFREVFLDQPDVHEALGRPTELEHLTTRLGPLQEGEIFEVISDPFLGIHGEAAAYRRRPVWAWVHNIGCSLDIGCEPLPEAS